MRSLFKDESGMIDIVGIATAVIMVIIIMAVGAYVAYQVTATASIPTSNQFYNSTSTLGTQFGNVSNFIFLAVMVIVIFGALFAALGLGGGRAG